MVFRLQTSRARLRKASHARNPDILQVHVHVSEQPKTLGSLLQYYICSRVPGPHPPPPPPGPPPPHPCSHRPRTTGTNPRNPEGGGTMENDPSQCFFTGAENCIRAGTGAPFARRKEQHHILYGNEHVTMTLLLTSGSNHTISL